MQASVLMPFLPARNKYKAWAPMSIMGEIKCVGVLTSGGDATGMNASVRAVTRAAIHKGWTVKGICRGFQGLIENEVIDLTTESVSNTIQRGGTFLKSARSEEFRTREGRQKAYEALPDMEWTL